MTEENWEKDNKRQACQEDTTEQQRRQAVRNMRWWRIRDVLTRDWGALIFLALVFLFVLYRIKWSVLIHLPWLYEFYRLWVLLILSCAASFLLLLYIRGNPTLSKWLD